MSTVYVQGRCPACHQESLTVDDDRHVLCITEGCPAPNAVAQLLEASPVSAKTALCPGCGTRSTDLPP